MRRSGPPSAHAIASRSSIAMRLEHLAAGRDAHELACQRHRGPDRTVGVEADAVGTARRDVGEHRAIGQRAVVGDREPREAAAERLRHDQRAAAVGDHAAVREAELTRRDLGRAVGSDEHEDAVGSDAEGNEPDVGVPACVDDHVVAAVGHQGRAGRRGR